MNQTNARNKLITTVAAVVVIMGLVVFAEYLQHRSSTTSSTASTGPSSSSSTSSGASANPGSATTASGSYKDGTYTADSQYYVPHGYEDIKVTLTVKDNMVTDSEIQNSESDPESARFQEDFAAEYKSNVVGKKIGDVNLTYIAGASDTTNGFNDAVNQIRNKAQA